MDNYLKKISRLSESGVIPKASLGNVQILHDDWCRKLQGKGECNCDPDIKWYPAETPEEFAATFMALHDIAQGQTN